MFDYSEEQFVKGFIEYSGNSKLVSDEKFPLVIEQFSTKIGIPDLVLVNKTASDIDFQFLKSFPLKNESSLYIQVLNAMSCKPHTMAYISHKSNINLIKSEKILKKLFALELVSKTRTGLFFLKERNLSHAIEFVSLEFKLNNWKSALRQSLKYRTFSDAVFVVMPFEKKKILNENIELFRRHGIGIAVFSYDYGDIEILLHPQKRKITSQYYANAVNNFLIQCS